jgi:hypothetical protein
MFIIARITELSVLIVVFEEGVSDRQKKFLVKCKNNKKIGQEKCSGLYMQWYLKHQEKR